MLSRTLLCLAVLSLTAPVLADTVWLKNGDRLTGKIKVFDGGKLLIQTDYAGAVPIDCKQVKTLESDQELLVKQMGQGDDCLACWPEPMCWVDSRSAPALGRSPTRCRTGASRWAAARSARSTS